jgi:low temperature requirement protein LtrA
MPVAPRRTAPHVHAAELFFDLCFVVAVARRAGVRTTLAVDDIGEGVGATLVFFAICGRG